MIRGSSKAVTQMSILYQGISVSEKINFNIKQKLWKKGSNELKKEKTTLVDVFMEGYTVDYARDFLKFEEKNKQRKAAANSI